MTHRFPTNWGDYGDELSPDPMPTMFKVEHTHAQTPTTNTLQNIGVAGVGCGTSILGCGCAAPILLVLFLAIVLLIKG